ncbi:chromate transporter [Aestuariispira insulae]|uniref:Chromate transporter n=2 Tax=Aestuariispira insulae TaxID=1461337 RepID=A0A3D9HW13_9PROT|nr:chromate transporter [Aestuariispira insulae]
MVTVWARIGFLSFGGPAAQIALMHKIIVEERRWLSERQYLNALSFCMLLPGPEAMQLATYTGWRHRGTLGGLIAGLLFVLPGAAVILGLAMLYVSFGETPAFTTIFLGIKAAVLVIVLEALLRVARKGLKRRDHWILAGLAFIALFFFSLPFPLVILAAAVYGFSFGRLTDEEPLTPDSRYPIGKTIRTICLWLAIWWGPIGLMALFDPGGILGSVGLFFSKLATVTFGGAYAVLAYMAQEAVQDLGWLSAAEMLDGLGLAETTPGPLILVTEFVGFLAGARGPDGIDLTYGFLAALVTLWATFAPCFLWVFAGAPYIEWLSTRPRLSGALSAISAAVVGVIMNLSVWFSMQVLFNEVTRSDTGPLTLWIPTLSSLDAVAALIAALASYLILVRKWGIMRTLTICALGAVGMSALVS